MTVRQADPTQFRPPTSQLAAASAAEVSPPVIYNHCVRAHRYGRQSAA
ncbi:hypothetical protein [Nocardia beijingensis]